MIKKYRKKPVVIEAVQWTGENLDEIKEFCGEFFNYAHLGSLSIFTLEGRHIASVRDYIIKGVAGEIYPCKPDIFEKTYEDVEEEE